MKKAFYLILLAVIAASCATLKVTSDYDKSANFAEFKTYNFTAEAFALPITDLNRDRLISAIEAELSAKGFTKSETPDVLIDLVLKAETKQTATATSTGGGYYGAGYRYGGGGFSTTTINYDSYQEGTLFVDMIDAKKLQLVWQGRGVGTMNPDASTKKREANIQGVAKMIFAKYPPKM